MNPEQPLIGPGGIVVMGIYVSSLLVLGWLGRKAQREKTLSDFYLGGRSLGFFVLLLTMYATQYSGNTLIGFSATAYRNGFTFLVAVSFMIGVVALQFLFAPRLHRLSRKYQFITLSDFIQHRFRHRWFTVLVSITGIIALLNYILTNLKAIGLVAETITGGRISMAEGIIALSVIILVYETLGGLRSVAWTDVIQGIILLVGCFVIFTVILFAYDGTSGISETLKQNRLDFWEPLRGADYRLWLSTLIVVCGGIAIYPHAIQRIYAAADGDTIKKAYSVMLFMPLVTTLLMIFVGWVGAAKIPGLDRAGSESITLLMLGRLVEQFPAMQIVIVLFMAAVFAAIMSTVDSALLSISSMITQDLYRPLKPNATEEQLTRLGKFVSWLLMGLIIPLAIYLPQTIWRLIEIKVELLVQALPALLLGLYWRRLNTRAAFVGFAAGTVITLAFTVGSFFTDAIPSKPFNMHAGFWGLMVNLLIVFVGSRTGDANPRSRHT